MPTKCQKARWHDIPHLSLPRGICGARAVAAPHDQRSRLSLPISQARAPACTWPATWGTVTLGPTIHYQDSRDDYEGGRITLEEFVPSARKLLPWITLADVQPGGSGIRAKLQGPGQPVADFMIERDAVNPRVIQAAGIDSPGLTSCLAIGNLVAEIWAAA